MAVHIKIPKKKVGPLSFGQEKSFKLKFFPFVTSIHELHLIGLGFMSKPITRIHERWVKVLNEHEVYVYKTTKTDCNVCSGFYGRVRTTGINEDPHVSKVFYWTP